MLKKRLFRMALLNINAAEKLTAKYNYSEWIIGGHSLGGVAASRYAIGHPDQTKFFVDLRAN